MKKIFKITKVRERLLHPWIILIKNEWLRLKVHFLMRMGQSNPPGLNQARIKNQPLFLSSPTLHLTCNNRYLFPILCSPFLQLKQFLLTYFIFFFPSLATQLRIISNTSHLPTRHVNGLNFDSNLINIQSIKSDGFGIKFLFIYQN